MFRTKQFLVETFSSPQGVISFLQAYGGPLPNFSAVEKWFQRSSIPSEWLPVLLGYVEIDRGSPVSIIPYLGAVR